MRSLEQVKTKFKSFGSIPQADKEPKRSAYGEKEAQEKLMKYPLKRYDAGHTWEVWLPLPFLTAGFLESRC